MDITDYPLTLTVKHVAEIMGICEDKAYDIVKGKGFPMYKDGKRLLIPRQAFWVWYNTKAVGMNLEDFGELGIDSDLDAASIQPRGVRLSHSKSMTFP